jgi:hypothetical protein
MSPISEFSGEFNDVLSDGYAQGIVTVGTTQVLAKVGASPLSGRENLRIYNKSNKTVYFGPTGVTTSTGEPIEKKQWINIPAGEAIGVYLITTEANQEVIVSEWA